jgi:hypothetical protein
MRIRNIQTSNNIQSSQFCKNKETRDRNAYTVPNQSFHEIFETLNARVRNHFFPAKVQACKIYQTLKVGVFKGDKDSKPWAS